MSRKVEESKSRRVKKLKKSKNLEATLSTFKLFDFSTFQLWNGVKP